MRIAKRLTQAELAELANVSLGALKHLESGSGATTTTLVKVVAALGQAGWIETLAPPPATFSPLELVEARDQQRKQERPRRVRRQAVATP